MENTIVQRAIDGPHARGTRLENGSFQDPAARADWKLCGGPNKLIFLCWLTSLLAHLPLYPPRPPVIHHRAPSFDLHALPQWLQNGDRRPLSPHLGEANTVEVLGGRTPKLARRSEFAYSSKEMADRTCYLHMVLHQFSTKAEGAISRNRLHHDQHTLRGKSCLQHPGEISEALRYYFCFICRCCASIEANMDPPRTTCFRPSWPPHL